MDLKELVQGYERNMKAIDKALTNLESEAQTIRGQLEARKLAQRRIGALEGKRADLAGERQELREAYQDASFESDELELERITDLRESIDEQIAKLSEDINAERASMPEVDSTQAVNVAVQKDMLKPINVQTFLDKLAETLKEQATEINSRIGRVEIPSSAYKREEYERIRAGKDSSYASSLAREKRLAAKDKERQAKMRPVSNTSEMADAMGSRHRPEDRMTVTSKGRKVKTYAQRGGNDDEADRTQVLSGEQVRAALAAK